jgi:hypothetical protein
MTESRRLRSSYAHRSVPSRTRFQRSSGSVHPGTFTLSQDFVTPPDVGARLVLRDVALIAALEHYGHVIREPHEAAGARRIAS